MKHSYALKSESKSKSGPLVEDSSQHWCGQNMVWCAVVVDSNDSFAECRWQWLSSRYGIIHYVL